MDETIRAPGGATVSSVLFACTYNAIRSPMAEALMKYFHGHRIYVDSVGVREGDPDPFMVAVMDEIGIDISKHEPVALSELHDTSFDLVVTLAPEAHHQVLELTRTMAFDVEYWPTIDPSTVTGSREQVLDAYRACRDQLFARIKQRFGLTGGPTV